MIPELIRSFLADPAKLEPRVTDQDRAAWEGGLRDIIEPALAPGENGAAGAYPLRPAQRAAFMGFADQRCALLLGPPGTGKTAVLAWMIVGYVSARRRAQLPCRVLVTGFTREAILNLLMAVSERQAVVREEFPVAFAGPSPERATSLATISLQSLARYLAAEHSVVGMTTWSSSKALNNGWYGGAPTQVAEVFDVVCIDEASQLKVAQGLMALAPLRNDGRIVVAGDDRQLPPIGSVDEWNVDNRALGGSLYDFLRSAAVPEFALNETFRLNRVLAAEPSRLFYNEEYESAVPERRLALRSDWNDGLPGWLAVALDPDNPVCILLHDGPPAATRSAFETELVADVVKAFAQRIRAPNGSPYGDRLWSDGLAVVTPHRAQNASIRSRIKDVHEDAVVDTVERIQGRERDAIIFSYTVSDPEFARIESRFLFSRERFNVAITRPRSKLILIVSRRLLNVLPSDEDVFDSVRVLREYVYGSTLAGSFEHAGLGYPTTVELRLRRFDDSAPLPDIDTVVVATEPPPVVTKDLEEVDAAIRKLSEEAPQFASTRSFDVNNRLDRVVPFESYRDLFRLGRIIITDEQKPPAPPYWRLVPTDDGLVPLPATQESVRENLAAVFEELRTGFDSVLYKGSRNGRGFRDRFCWCNSEGTDVLWPVLQAFQEQGFVVLGQTTDARPTVKVTIRSEEASVASPVPTSGLTDDDFRLLNALEDREIGRANLGVFETWLDPLEILKWARARGIEGESTRSLRALERSLGRLEEHGFVLVADGRVRSRMGELARELRLVKQRFRAEDQDRRPFLVRSLKLEARTRFKPLPTIPLTTVVDSLAPALAAAPGASRILGALVPTMRRGFGLMEGAVPLISGFQQRALESIATAWVEKRGRRGFVITADTGSGKTEAACMPLLCGAALDRAQGIAGARAVLLYPRIRLAVNQAARLVKYAKLFSDQLKDVLVTVGLQCADVPSSWQQQRVQYDRARDKGAELWQPGENGGWKFPFFPCPNCDGEFTLFPAAPAAAGDTLRCAHCHWSFDGWAGSKDRLSSSPPALFLTVTESLHQWMQDPRYGSLFGDLASYHPPRAVLADEIHLYTHTHGSQVGWAIRRLLGRCKLNGETSSIAIGMSATLGDPREVWGELSGFGVAGVERIQPTDDDRVENPRGREYFYFVQPEVESRGKDIAAASTTIQALMLLAHGMRRRPSPNGGFRAVAFLDSIDKLKRLHSDFIDAEVNKRLGKLRTKAFGRDPQNPRRLVDRCCGEPRSCSRFRAGECWWFAANDPLQCGAGGRQLRAGESLNVARSPVFSGTSGNVDRLIEGTDVLFATSSLEVGYDDPEMALVYQHYAPANMASFIQRKGRGGRGANDRPITGVTLSLYSPRDAYFFRDPRRLLDPADFRVPVNMSNTFVRRGHALAAILDIAARAIAQRGWRPDPALDTAILGAADEFVRDVFGPRIYSELEVEDLPSFWAKARAEAEPRLMPNQQVREWRAALRGHPQRLFDPPNAASIRVHVPDRIEPAIEDVALALSECAPGRITRRWGSREAHWIPLGGSRGTFASDVGRDAKQFSLAPGATAQDMARVAPSDVLRALGGSLPSHVVRPVVLRPRVAGEFIGTEWVAAWGWNEDERRCVPLAPGIDGIPLHHKSQSRLLGFTSVTVEGSARNSLTIEAISRLGAAEVEVFLADQGKRFSGLRAVQAYWGCDADLVLDTPKREHVQQRQLFVSSTGEAALVGYGMQPEGIRLRLDSQKIDEFVRAEEESLERDAHRARWHRGQFLRYALMTGVSGAGLTTYEARQLAELSISAAADPDSRDELATAATRGNASRFREALESAYKARLSYHPLLTAQRVGRVLDRLTAPGAMRAIKAAFEQVKDPDAFSMYVRTALLQSLLVRLRDLFVVHGLGDERQVLGHARLPLQYGDGAEDILTVCERSSGGDGTTRAFLEAAPAALTEWVQQGFVTCPNAEADQILARAFSQREQHGRWRARDPRDADWVAELGRELGVDAKAGAGALQPLLRLLYDFDEVAGRRFDLYDLYVEIEDRRRRMASDFGRSPTDWELVSDCVAQASADATSTPRLRALLEAYAAQEDAVSEEALSPEGRLAELVYRLGARLCEDGCQACVHTHSDLMPDDVAEAATSRVLLERFASFLSRITEAP